MSKRKISGELNQFHEFKKGEPLVGAYQGSRMIGTVNGQSRVHTVELENGELRDFFGSAVLNSAMNQVEAGEIVEIIFTGEGKTKAGRPVNNYDVFIQEHDKA